MLHSCHFNMACSLPVSELQCHVKCGVCLEIYDNNRVPKILPCQHTLCARCIQELPTRSQTWIACPICRTRVQVQDSILNRVVLNIAEDLVQKASTIVKCADHDKDFVLVCMDCLVGLCSTCLMQKSHNEHNKEELSDAKKELSERIGKMINEQKTSVESKTSILNDSPYCIIEINKAEHDIKKICDDAHAIISEWSHDQLSMLKHLKEEREAIEKELKTASDVVESLSPVGNSDMGTLLQNTRTAILSKDKIKSCKLPETPSFDYTEKCQVFLSDLIRSIQSALNSVTSKLLQPQKASSSDR